MSFAYPDETGKTELGVRLWHAQMTDGEIIFPSPEECGKSMYRPIRPMHPTQFGQKYHYFSAEDENA